MQTETTAHVCSNVQFSIRMENLSFGHHQIVAPLTAVEQKLKDGRKDYCKAFEMATAMVENYWHLGNELRRMSEAAVLRSGPIADKSQQLRISDLGVSQKLSSRTQKLAEQSKAELHEGIEKAFVFRSNFARRNLSGDQKKAARKAMFAVAKELREDDVKHWTETRLGGVFGVGQQTVSDWFAETKARSNTGTGNASEPIPDARVKINPKDKPIIAARLAAGESQEQVEADFGVSQRTISTIRKSETKKTEAAKQRKKAAKAIKGRP